MRVIVLCLLIAGCSTPSELRFERAEATCDKIGFARDTDQYRNCMATTMAARRPTILRTY